MKKVLLTGASGFIGRNTLSGLISKGFEIHAVTSKSTKNLTAFGNIYYHQADLLDPLQTEKLMTEVCPSHLLHFAWYAIPGKFWTAPTNLDWIKSSLHLFQSFVEHGGKRAVISGTCAEYDWNYEICSEATTPLSPSTFYGTCKASLFQILNSYAKQINLSFSWGRIFFLYGPNEYSERLVPNVILNLMRKQTARCSHGMQIRDFMHVEDVADAFVHLLDSEFRGPFNIASGQPVTLREVIDLIGNKLNAGELIQYGAIPTNDAPKILADVNRLKNDLKWTPKYNLDKGLEQTIEWWKKKYQELCNH